MAGNHRLFGWLRLSSKCFVNLESKSLSKVKEDWIPSHGRYPCHEKELEHEMIHAFWYLSSQWKPSQERWHLSQECPSQALQEEHHPPGIVGKRPQGLHWWRGETFGSRHVVPLIHYHLALWIRTNHIDRFSCSFGGEQIYNTTNGISTIPALALICQQTKNCFFCSGKPLVGTKYNPQRALDSCANPIWINVNHNSRLQRKTFKAMRWSQKFVWG